MGISRRSKNKRAADVSRRDFLKAGSVAAIAAGIECLFPQFLWLDDAVAALPASEGYLLVDTKKCQGCMSCMLACSLVHEGRISPSLSRIQVTQNSFEKFPGDLMISQCRQCVDPSCVEACPVEALHVDGKNGNVRRVDIKKCIGCKACTEACPYQPERAMWNYEDKHGQKCDLCTETPFWDNQGGPRGKQACIEVCAMKAITFTRTIPEQKGDRGYRVNLRGKSWKKLGFPTD